MAKNSYGWASPSSGSSNFKSTQGQGDFSQGGGGQQNTAGMRREAELMQSGMQSASRAMQEQNQVMPGRNQATPARNYGSRGTPQEMAQGRTMTQGSGVPADRQILRPQQVDRGNVDAGRMGQMASNAQAFMGSDQNRSAVSQAAAPGSGNGSARNASGGNGSAGNAPSPGSFNSPTMPQRSMPQRSWSDYGGGEGYGNLGQAFSDGNQYQFSATTNNQVPRPAAPERAPALTNLGQTYTPGSYGSPQQQPVSQQNGYTDGRAPGTMSGGATNVEKPLTAMGGAASGGGGGVSGFGTQGGMGGGGMNRRGTREGGAPTGGAGGIPSNFDINQFLSLFGAGGRFAPDQLGQGDRAPEMQYYANSITPFLNFMGQGADREQNMEQFNATLEQQKIKDAFGMGIDDRGMTLQENAFGEGNRQWGATFGEGQRQFNLGFGEEQRQFDTTTGFNYDRMNTEDQQARALAQLQSQTARRGQDVDAYGIQQRTGVDMRGQDVERYLGDRRIDSDIYLGDRQYDTQRYLGDRQYDTQRYGIDTEAEVARQRMENELMQSRYNTFGRAQQPNFRMMGGWR